MAPPRSKPLLLGTSLKMYFDLPSTQSYIRALSQSPLATSPTLPITLFIIPDFISLLPAAALLQPTPILLGAQDCAPHPSGPHTGSVSPLNLRQAGVAVVELGHAERRAAPHAESDADVAAKAAAVVAQGLIPLVCVGESAAPPAAGPASAAVGRAVAEVAPQVMKVLKALPRGEEVWFAYEPVWAIGAQEPAGRDHVVAVVAEIRRMSEGREGVVRILYGGSAGPGTWEGLKDGVDGLFLGRFAHDVKGMERVIEEMSR